MSCTSESHRAGPWDRAVISVKEREVKQSYLYFLLKQDQFNTNVKLDVRWIRQSRSQRRITFTLGSVGEGSKVQCTLISCSIQRSWTREQKLSSAQITCRRIISITKRSRHYLRIRQTDTKRKIVHDLTQQHDSKPNLCSTWSNFNCSSAQIP